MIKTTLISRLVNIWFACCPDLMHDVNSALDSTFLSAGYLLATLSMLMDDGSCCSCLVSCSILWLLLAYTGKVIYYVFIVVLSLCMVKAAGCCLK
jgi:hypothetical protein